MNMYSYCIYFKFKKRHILYEKRQLNIKKIYNMALLNTVERSVHLHRPSRLPVVAISYMNIDI